ncbi:MAG TPA: hypothetical protein VJ990_02990 [Clostridia bacterium]|nr:hypothetical protein [Clostridia bacterium]
MFNRIMDLLKRAFRNEKGQGMVEYILLVIVIAFVAIIGFSALGDSVNNKTSQAGTSINAENATIPVLFMVR